MDPNDLAAKRAAAKLAMTGNTNSYPQALAGLRQKNLEPNLLQSNSLDPAVLEKRRQEARQAMETAEQRQRRLAEEKKEAQEALTQKRVEELKQARLALEQKRIADSTDLVAQAEKAEAEAKRIYNQKIEAARTRIEEIAKTPSVGPRNIRTLNNDLAREVTDPDFSVAKTLIEQRKNQRLASSSSRPSSNTGLILGIALLLIILSGGALTGTYYLTTTKTNSVTPLTLDQIVFTDLTTKININSSLTVVNDVNSNRRDNENTINNIFLLTTSTSSGDRSLTRTEWFDFFHISPPLSFNHFLIDRGNFGVSNYGTSSIWFVLKTRSYEQTFDSLLREGKNIVLALYRPFVSQSDLDQLSQAKTKESIIDNVDVGIWQTASSTILIYGFVDKETLIIAQNEETFSKLLDGYLGKR